MAELTKEEEQTDWYDVLGLEVDVDDGAITKAFKKLSLKWHPDKNQGSKAAHEMFMRVKEAKNFLLDVKKRRTYDEKRAERRRMETLLVSLFDDLISRVTGALACIRELTSRYNDDRYK